MLRQIPTFVDEDGNTVVFRRVPRVPGFTHRVIVNGHPAGWLADTHRPSRATAAFFLATALAHPTPPRPSGEGSWPRLLLPLPAWRIDSRRLMQCRQQ